MVPIRLSQWKTRAFAAAGVLLLLVISAVTIITAVLSIWSAAPIVEEYEARETTVIYDAGGEPLAGLFEEDRTWVSLQEIPAQLQQAFIAIEDRNFRHHRGVDLRAIARALVSNLRNLGIVEGGSTITQQLARNVYLDHTRTFTRKLQEMRIALELERRYSKAEILEMYLNEIYLGSGTYGVQTAARRYFNKDLDELDLEEIALLAALPRSPEHYSPHRNPEGARQRRDLVLQTMSNLGYITQHEADEAATRELQVAKEPLEAEDIGRYFVKHVRNRLIARYGAHRVYTGGLRVHTTLDRDKQQAAENAVEQAIEAGSIPTREVGTGAGDEAVRRVARRQPQPALVTVDTESGAVRAMIGGRGEDSLNRAAQSVRQPGSAFKPFVYAAAIREGRYPGTVVNDLPVVFRDPAGEARLQVWPVNYDHRYRGLISYRDALAYSVNVAAVRTLAAIGVEEVRSHVDRYGFSTLTEQDGAEHHYAFALGGLERGVTPLEMAAAYGVFHDGRPTPAPHTITKVETPDGEVLFEHDRPRAALPGSTASGDTGNPEPGDAADPGPATAADPGPATAADPGPATAAEHSDEVLSDAESYVMRDMLRSVMDRGTGWRAAQEIPVAGKTGTSDNNTDGWFVGFADELVTAVWIGEDSPAPMEYVSGEDGEVRLAGEEEPEVVITGVHASLVWAEYMREVLAADDGDANEPDGDNDNGDNDNAGDERPNRWERRERPAEVVEIEIDPVTGLAPAASAPVVENELATEESAPENVSGFWDEIETAEVDLRSGRLLNPVCVFPYAETRRYVADGRYRVGPARIPLGGSEMVVTSDGSRFHGVYEVGRYEPVQKIDPELRIPADPASIAIERVPELPCLLPTGDPAGVEPADEPDSEAERESAGEELEDRIELLE